MKFRTTLAVFCVLLSVLPFGSAQYVEQLSGNVQAEFSAPNGRLTIRVKSTDSVQLIGLHYSINKPLQDVAAGDWNYDLTESADGWYRHVNQAVSVKSGDVVNYWLIVIKRTGLPEQFTNKNWKVGSDGQASSAKPTTGSGTTRATTPRPTTPRPTKPTVQTTKKPTDGNSSGSGGCNCKGQTRPVCHEFPCLIFEDEFDTLDFTKWQHEITAGGGGNWEFQVYTNNRSNSYVRDGLLYLKPTLTSDKFGEEFLRNGQLDIWGGNPGDQCTSEQWWGCRRQGHGANIINPIQSARLRTTRKFAFRYGRLEVRAKMPTGDWIWPAIWMLPEHFEYGGWPASGEIDLVEIRANRFLYNEKGDNVGVQETGSTLHWGPNWNYNQWSRTHKTKRLDGDRTFGNEFHVFRMDWSKDSMEFFVDDEHLLTVDPGDEGFWKFGEFDKTGMQNPWRDDDKMAPFNRQFFLIMNVAVGSTAFFPDTWRNGGAPKPWSNTSPQAMLDFWNKKNDWYPTWTPDVNNGEDAAMQVDYVRVWKLEPDEEVDVA